MGGVVWWRTPGGGCGVGEWVQLEPGGRAYSLRYELANERKRNSFVFVCFFFFGEAHAKKKKAKTKLE